MLSSQIPEFVRDVVATGCNICAVGQEHYLFGDGDLKDEDFERVSGLLGDIDARYGERDHLRADIVAYLAKYWTLHRYRRRPRVPQQSIGRTLKSPRILNSSWENGVEMSISWSVERDTCQTATRRSKRLGRAANFAASFSGIGGENRYP